jgi:hypothetical protein
MERGKRERERLSRGERTRSRSRGGPVNSRLQRWTWVFDWSDRVRMSRRGSRRGGSLEGGSDEKRRHNLQYNLKKGLRSESGHVMFLHPPVDPRSFYFITSINPLSEPRKLPTLSLSLSLSLFGSSVLRFFVGVRSNLPPPQRRTHPRGTPRLLMKNPYSPCMCTCTRRLGTSSSSSPLLHVPPPSNPYHRLLLASAFSLSLVIFVFFCFCTRENLLANFISK